MPAFRVDDMRCGHCAGLITKALKAADAKAEVAVDLTRRLVRVESAAADPEALRRAIVAAGYTAAPVDAAAGPAAAMATRACCGCGG